MKIYCRAEVYLHIFLNLALESWKSVVSYMALAFTPEQRGSHWIGGWVCSGFIVDAVGKRLCLPLPGH